MAGHPLEDGEGEGGGLARARLGGGEDVAPGEDMGDGRGLDGGGLGIALLRDGGKQVGREAEISECQVRLQGVRRSARGPLPLGVRRET